MKFKCYIFSLLVSFIIARDKCHGTSVTRQVSRDKCHETRVDHQTSIPLSPGVVSSIGSFPFAPFVVWPAMVVL